MIVVYWVLLLVVTNPGFPSNILLFIVLAVVVRGLCLVLVICLCVCVCCLFVW